MKKQLAPIKITKFTDKKTKVTLMFKTKFIVTPVLDKETQGLLIAENKEIGLYAYAFNRRKLITEIKEQLLFMWDAYVTTCDRKLNENTLKLKQVLMDNLIQLN